MIRWPESPTESLGDLAREIEAALSPLVRPSLSLEHHYLERVDIRLEPLNDLEVVRAVSSQGSADTKLPEGLRLNQESLAENIVVRIGQVAHWPAHEVRRGRISCNGFRCRRQIMGTGCKRLSIAEYADK